MKKEFNSGLFVVVAPVIVFFSLITTAIYSVDNGRGFDIITSIPWQIIFSSFVVLLAIAGIITALVING